MRLLRRAARMEAAAAYAAGESRPIALVWTSDNERVDDSYPLEEGEHVATDVYVVDAGGGEAMVPPRYRLVERVTDLAHDHGVVRREHGGEIIGRVRESAEPYLDIEWYPAAGELAT